ncbi:polyprenol phosphomannose-dependent alpha 1,6 mannosyltransferase MptB [Streptomyces sp. NPDC001941]|uniref:polyprenol phosphomannose-dependent alpha 1,6 mannosyltransferase MptB n=1 Tax=Streptomyces sp. NPDC001941 TaxID=3154659 RepID=UPI003317EF52
MWVFLGVLGSFGVAVGGWFAGALPVREPWGVWTGHSTAVTVAGALAAYLGLTLLLVAWWRYGKGDRPHPLRTLAAWSAPLLLAPPLYSADVYSYIAQGAMVLEGHDVYTDGPSVLPPDSRGADAAASVGGHWTDTPAPYGPAFLLLAKGVVALTGGAVVPSVLAFRLFAVASLALIVWGVRALARERGADEGGALWLAALNPLLLIHVVGGTHNDGLMAGLVLAGAVWALRGRWAVAAVLIACAAMVKSPAALALLFVGVVVWRRGGGAPWSRAVRAFVLPGAVAAAVAAGASVLAGTGLGWARTQSVAGTIHTALSLSSDLGLGLGQAARVLLGADPDPVKGAVQSLGLALALAVIGWLALRSLRPWRGRPVLDPVHALGLALLALVALSPMVQPWYLLWGTVVVAATAWSTTTGRVLAVLSAALTYETAPDGHTPWYGFVLAGLVCAAGLLWLRRSGADRATGVAGVAEKDSLPA